jgi:2-amino-4-hydroxy-6-hydroxymethyldihydropteridine diphosphokinase
VPTVYLSLGSNVGDRAAWLRAALEAMPGAGVRVLRVSPVYETEPVDYTDQPRFLNLAVEAETELCPEELLSRTAAIEQQLGRLRDVPKGPRTLDIDILLYGDSVLSSERLQIPHPRMHERAFVLQPLADLAPDLLHPVLHQSVRQILAGLPPLPAPGPWPLAVK